MEGAARVAEVSATADGDRLFERDRNGIARPALDIRVSNYTEKIIHFLARRSWSGMTNKQGTRVSA